MTMKPKFSDRIGITKPNPIQFEDMNLSLKNSIWNLTLRKIIPSSSSYCHRRVLYIAEYFLKVPTDIVPPDEKNAQNWLKNWFYDKKCQWWNIYNFLEFLAENYEAILDNTLNQKAFTDEANKILEAEASGYRFIGNRLTPITNQNEIMSITEGIENSATNNLFGTAKHLNTSIELLANRPNPDYRNSIKESISAIEALVKQITGKDSSSLDKALTILDSKVKFHGAFKSGLLSLYGYTSSEDGIRHAILEEKDVGFDEAKFMLVTCSALVNFIIAKASKHGLLPPS